VRASEARGNGGGNERREKTLAGKFSEEKSRVSLSLPRTACPSSASCPETPPRSARPLPGPRATSSPAAAAPRAPGAARGGRRRPPEPAPRRRPRRQARARRGPPGAEPGPVPSGAAAGGRRGCGRRSSDGRALEGGEFFGRGREGEGRERDQGREGREREGVRERTAEGGKSTHDAAPRTGRLAPFLLIPSGPGRRESRGDVVESKKKIKQQTNRGATRAFQRRRERRKNSRRSPSPSRLPATDCHFLRHATWTYCCVPVCCLFRFFVLFGWMVAEMSSGVVAW